MTANDLIAVLACLFVTSLIVVLVLLD